MGTDQRQREPVLHEHAIDGFVCQLQATHWVRLFFCVCVTPIRSDMLRSSSDAKQVLVALKAQVDMKKLVRAEASGASVAVLHEYQMGTATLRRAWTKRDDAAQQDSMEFLMWLLHECGVPTTFSLSHVILANDVSH